MFSLFVFFFCLCKSMTGSRRAAHRIWPDLNSVLQSCVFRLSCLHLTLCVNSQQWCNEQHEQKKHKGQLSLLKYILRYFNAESAVHFTIIGKEWPFRYRVLKDGATTLERWWWSHVFSHHFNKHLAQKIYIFADQRLWRWQR